MKKLILSVTVLSTIILTANTVVAAVVVDHSIITSKHDDKKTDTFKVYGNCGMCEKTIEGALKGVKGIDKADWNKETKMIDVVYHTHDISLDDIKKKIAEVGYDTEEHRASEKVYNNLPGCCQYERPETMNEDHSGHNH
jgi:copper chaperone CopZ